MFAGCYAASSGDFLPTDSDNLSVPSSRFSSQTVGIETSVSSYHNLLRSNLKERSSRRLVSLEKGGKMVTNTSSGGYKMVTNTSSGGYKMVTNTSSGGYKMGLSWPVRRYYSVLRLREREELYSGDILEVWIRTVVSGTANIRAVFSILC